MSISPLATDEQLQRYLSVYGIATFADHDGDGTADDFVLSDCQTFADGEIIGRLCQRYTTANIALGTVIPEISVVLSLYELCLRRGSAPPASLAYRYEQLTKEGGMLDRIASGKLPLVDSDGVRVPQKSGYAPSHANLTIDRWFSEKRVRVVDGSSSMPNTVLRRDVDRGFSNE